MDRMVIMPMGVTIVVTQKDINEGTKNDCEKCPIALAAFRRLGLQSHSQVTVYSNTLYIVTNSKKRVKAFIPKRASKFIVDFDEGHSVKPMRFKVEFQEVVLCSTTKRIP